ncbi:MAG: hypothetical protein ACE5I1_13645 [bacterium]
MQKTDLIFVFIVFLCPLTVFGQSSYIMPGQTNQGVFMGGLGVSVIDDETFVTFNFYPEFAIGKVGFGLNIPLRFNTETGDLREEDWDEGYDYFRILRFIRYGYKRDPFYARLGELDATRIGHGFIMNFYNNNIINYDKRKIGLVLDIDAGVAGFESMTSNLGRAEIFGSRVYYRPLFESSTPILRYFAIGASYVTDIDPDQNRNSNDDITEIGLDIELPLLKTPVFQTLLYADYAKISRHGSGKAIGVELTLQGIGGTFSFIAQLERRFLNADFLPAYFNAFYEIDRFRPMPGDTAVFRKEDLLAKQPKTRGTFGLLRGTVLNTIDVLGTFERLDGISNSGVLHIQAIVPNTVPKMSLRAAYDRTGIDSFSDAFQLDNRSVARLGLGYKINPFIVVYMDYIWTNRFV